jgi:hypothetical protein
MRGCNAWFSINVLSLKIVGMQMDFDGFPYESVSVPCTPGENGDFIEVNFVSNSMQFL